MINSVLKNVEVEEVDEGIFSCIDRNRRQSDYDGKVYAYDLVVVTPFTIELYGETGLRTTRISVVKPWRAHLVELF